METLHRLAAADPGFIIATPFVEVDVTNTTEVGKAALWWEEMTSKGGEGMVVKPLDFIAHGPKGLVQRRL
jgi:protein phosphatase